MKRSARNLIQQIRGNGEGFDVSSFPSRVLEPACQKEEVLANIIVNCEKRKKDCSIPLCHIIEENNRELKSAMGIGIPGIDILALCGLLISCIRELDTELIGLKGELDQLQAENFRLKSDKVLCKKL